MTGASEAANSVLAVKCPHCRTAFDRKNAQPDEYQLGWDGEYFWVVLWVKCPTCERFVIDLLSAPEREDGVSQQQGSGEPKYDLTRLNELQVHPLGKSRPLSSDVPAAYADRFQKAVQVLPLAADASAALSRRLLQDLIREEAEITKRDLYTEVQELLDSNALPSDLANDLDAIRTVGNFAAHSIKSQSTGQVVDVEIGEAEWLIEVLEELFDFYFLRPKERQRRRDKLNEKLRDAGKDELKAAQP